MEMCCPKPFKEGGTSYPGFWSVVSGHPSAVSSFRRCKRAARPQVPASGMELDRPAFGFNRGVSARLSQLQGSSGVA